MDAAYALMVRTYAGIPGSNLLEAVDRANASFGIENPAAVDSVDAKNQASLDQLSGMMRGVR